MSPEDTPREAEEALEPASPRGERRLVAPAVDIYEEDDGLVIVADMPGVPRDGVSAGVEGGVLTIEGKVPQPSEAEAALYSEYEPADFHRCFALGESIDPGGITATLHNGVLTVRLPKAEAARTRKIEITGE
jgi:HSP20 family protein